MLRPDYFLTATGNTGTTPTSTVQPPIGSSEFTPAFSNDAIAPDQRSQAGSTSSRGRSRGRGLPGPRSQTNRRNRRAVRSRRDPDDDDDDEGDYTDSDTGEEGDGYDINRERSITKVTHT